MEKDHNLSLDFTSPLFWGTFFRSGWRAIVFLFRQVFPLVSSIAIEIRQRIKIKMSEMRGDPFWPDESFLKLSLEELAESHKLEVERRATLQGKAQVNLGTAALASSFGLGIIALLPKPPDLKDQIERLLPFVVLAATAFSIWQAAQSAQMRRGGSSTL